MASKQDIHVSYDVGNDFFRLWLDESMNYSCAVFRGDESLEQAQVNKLAILSDLAQVTPDAHTLDIGCGWGANLDYLARTRGVRRAVGLTLSEAQHHAILERRIPGVDVVLADYRDFQPIERFDRVFCLCMFEHIATPEQARTGEHMDVFRDFFRRVHDWTRPGARFAMQSTLIYRLPRDRRQLRGLASSTRTILPGSKCAYLSEIAQAITPYWELETFHNRREHYVRTSLEWLRRLERNEAEIRRRWGDTVYADYRDYLAGCAEMFEHGYLQLAQFALRRRDHL